MDEREGFTIYCAIRGCDAFLERPARSTSSPDVISKGGVFSPTPCPGMWFRLENAALSYVSYSFCPRHAVCLELKDSDYGMVL